MASGKLGIAAPAANTDVIVYTVPASKVATVNVGVVNRGTDDAVVNVAIAASGATSAAEYVEYGVTIPANGVLERSGLVVGAGENVVVRSSTANCSVRVNGFEEGV